MQHNQEHSAVLHWLTGVDCGAQQSDCLAQRQEGTGQWLLETEHFNSWMESGEQTLFCPGIPGAGKTILASTIINHLQTTFQDRPEIAIAYIYFSYKRQEEQTLNSSLASLLRQLAETQSSLPKPVQRLYDLHCSKRTRPSVDELTQTLRSVIAMYTKVYIVVDALDECQSHNGCRSEFIFRLFTLQDQTGANLLATSRFITEIVETFHGKPMLEIRASEEDVRGYLSGNISRFPGFVRRDPGLQEQIISGVVRAAEGM